MYTYVILNYSLYNTIHFRFTSDSLQIQFRFNLLWKSLCLEGNSLFAAAFIEELTTHPEGRIDRHYTRMREEMSHISPNQDTCTPLLVPSSRSLWSHNIAHFVLTPNIATAIANLPSDQSRHELLPIALPGADILDQAPIYSITRAGACQRGIRGFRYGAWAHP
ncbi:hypothetical protein ACN38_g9004 [Penicillium nordicum]|uniref:Uncharacterized protein n=1 Tax=Penicillium nordicum TaxID=229535 RepID=A0A0M8P3W7_9EURO|nr:hypothetical protein ACN38_g9004 [Penicillium nordicum]